MLEIQKYLLSGKTLDDLVNEFAIELSYNADKTAVILNYDQIESRPETHEIVMDCRNLILRVGSWELISRSFKRFFNSIQHPLLHENFDWKNFTTQDKKDGSLTSLFYFNNEWMMSTRRSWGHGQCGDSGKSWSELFFSVLSKDKVDRLCKPGLSYIFEYCGPWNQVVAYHPDNALFLLTAFNGEEELSVEQVDQIAKELDVHRPEVYKFDNIEQIESYINSMLGKDPMWEGVVIRDINNLRQKIKNPDYLALHKVVNNGLGFNTKALVPLALNEDQDETIAYIKKYREQALPLFEKIKERLDRELANLLELWDSVKNIENQREFAMAIKDRTKFSNILFRSRSTKQGKSVVDLWRESEDLILKVLFKEKTNS